MLLLRCGEIKRPKENDFLVVQYQSYVKARSNRRPSILILYVVPLFVNNIESCQEKDTTYEYNGSSKKAQKTRDNGDEDKESSNINTKMM